MRTTRITGCVTVGRVDEEGAKKVALRPRSSSLQVGTDALIAELARRQNGRVTRAQLLSAGVTVAEIKHRLATRRLHAEHPGVYAVGYRTRDMWARFRTALLFVGDDGILSHFAAAAAHDFGADPVVVDVTCPRKLRSPRGIRLHHHILVPAEVTHHHTLPLTSPSQTLFDLSRYLTQERLTKTANQAFVDRKLTITDLRATQARNANRKGAAAFTALLATLDPEGHRVESPLEVRLNAFLRARGFPPWESNVPLRIGTETIRPDVLWRPQRVIVEADGRDPHLAPLTFTSDRRRDRRCRVEGWEPVRVTSEDLGAGADELDADLRTLLSLSPPA